VRDRVKRRRRRHSALALKPRESERAKEPVPALQECIAHMHMHLQRARAPLYFSLAEGYADARLYAREVCTCQGHPDSDENTHRFQSGAGHA
jgi:hypothetical protein